MARRPEAKDRTKINRIVLVDDHPLVRERLREVIDREPDLKVRGEAEDRAQALALLDKTPCELALVDLSLKGGSSGLELIKDIRACRLPVRILVLSMHEESLYAERAVRAGANGYITKQEATRKVVQAIRTVLDGEMYVSPSIAHSVLSKVMGDPTPAPALGIEKLSDRELEVFRLVGKGLSSRQMAETMNLDLKTVETYRARIREKLAFKDAGEMRQAAINWGYTEHRC